MSINRRNFLKSTSAAAAAVAAPAFIGRAQAADALKMAVILDQTGGLDIYGRPMVDASHLAVEEINAAGGLLGKQVDLTVYDPQSTIQFYTQYATKAATSDRVDVVQAGITSASRESIRPLLSRYQTLYFYNTLYEGGVCDTNNYCTGSTPGQTVEKLVPYTMNKWGKDGSCEVPPYYVSQIKHYCSVFGYNEVDLAVIHMVNSPSFRVHTFEFSNKELNEYRQKAYDFWAFVVNDEEPPIGKGEGTKEMLRQRYPMAETGVHTVANDGILEAVTAYGGIKTAIREMKSDQTEFSNQIIRHMEVSESLLNPQGEEIATFKNDTKGVRRLTIK